MTIKLRASKIQFIGDRPEQQDAVRYGSLSANAAGNAGIIYGVLTDGIGGLPNGAQASETVNRTVAETIEAEHPEVGNGDLDLRALLRSGVEAGNAALHAYVRRLGSPHCGTTLVAVIFAGTRLFHISVGDSLLLAYGPQVGLSRLNAPHTVSVDGKSMLASAVTGEPIPAIDEGTIDLDKKGISQIMLSSDGINGLPLDTLTRILEGTDPNKLQQVIASVRALAARRQDNTSIILFERLPELAGSADVTVA